MSSNVITFPVRHIDLAERAAMLLLRYEESRQTPSDLHAVHDALGLLGFQPATIKTMLEDVRPVRRESVA